MTNTLHRFGPSEEFKDDYILFAMCTRGKNDVGGADRLRKFLDICARHRPVNMGDSKLGGINRPSRNLNPMVHWRRAETGTYQQVIEGIESPTTAAAVFDNLPALRSCLEEVKAADLGLSVNIAALTDDARRCSMDAGIAPHAVEYSFGFLGKTAKLPEENTLTLMTMCGHGMISAAYAQKMIDWVLTGRKTPDACARSMSRFCVCGIFNPVRAERIFCRIANRSPHSEAS